MVLLCTSKMRILQCLLLATFKVEYTLAASIRSSHEIQYSNGDGYEQYDDEDPKYFVADDGSLMYDGEDGYLYTDTSQWESNSLHLIQKAYPKQQVWLDEDFSDQESPSRSILYDDLVLLFGEEWGDELYQMWEEEVDFEDVDENDEYADSPIKPPSVDKYFQSMLDVINDPDCMEGEVDMASPTFSVERAVQIWHKCHLLVIRNVFTHGEDSSSSHNLIEEFRSNVTSFIYDVKYGRVNDNGTTTYNEPMYMHDVEVNRWDMLLPQNLAFNKEILAPSQLMEILEDERVLGTAFKSLSFGVVMAESDSSGQKWHQDERPMYGDASVFHNKHGGHEHPPLSIVALAPLINMTRAHGPTEFCMGSSAVNGIFTDYLDLMTWESFELKNKIMELYEGYPPDKFLYSFCPTKMWRSPTLQAGDMVLWDYNLNHRAGANDSSEFRVALYTSYSRRSIQDRTFETFEDQPGNGPRLPDGSPDVIDFSNRSLRKGRFAMIDGIDGMDHVELSFSQRNNSTINNHQEEEHKENVCVGGHQEEGQCSSSSSNPNTKLHSGIFSRL